MSSLKGYRTVLLNMLMTLAMGGTIQLSAMPSDIQHALTLLTVAWGFLSVLLRLATDTPIGKKVIAAIERDTGLSDADMQAIEARILPKTATLADLEAQGEKLLAAIQNGANPAPQPQPQPGPSAPA